MRMGEDLLGWRARVGLIVPGELIPTEPWFYRVAPRGVTFLTSRVLEEPETTVATMLAQRPLLARAAQELATAKVDLICYACTSGSFIGGRGYDEQLIKEIEDSAGIPATTTSTSVLEALKALKLKRLVVTTPYIEEVDATLKNFLEDNGFEILKIRGMGIPLGVEETGGSPGEIYKFSKAAWTPEADGLFMSCMQFMAFDIIETLEIDIGKPVVTANQATLWNILRLVEVREPINGYGQLLREIPPLKQ